MSRLRSNWRKKASGFPSFWAAGNRMFNTCCLIQSSAGKDNYLDFQKSTQQCYNKEW
jgi:hypothetical protein